MRIYLKNISVEFHPDPIWNDRALGFFEQRRPNNKTKSDSDKMSSDMGSVPDQKKFVSSICSWILRNEIPNTACARPAINHGVYSQAVP